MDVRSVGRTYCVFQLSTDGLLRRAAAYEASSEGEARQYLERAGEEYREYLILPVYYVSGDPL